MAWRILWVYWLIGFGAAGLLLFDPNGQWLVEGFIPVSSITLGTLGILLCGVGTYLCVSVLNGWKRPVRLSVGGLVMNNGDLLAWDTIQNFEIFRFNFISTMYIRCTDRRTRYTVQSFHVDNFDQFIRVAGYYKEHPEKRDELQWRRYPTKGDPAELPAGTATPAQPDLPPPPLHLVRNTYSSFFASLYLLALFCGMGSVFCYMGYHWLSISPGCGSTPEPISMAELERGVPSNAYRTLGEHVPVLDLLIYEVDRPGRGLADVYYPVVTVSEVRAAVREACTQLKVEPEEVPDKAVVMRLPIKVLVKMRKYDSMKELQGAVEKGTFPTSGLTGLAMSGTRGLAIAQRDMIRSSYDHLDLDRVVVFTAGGQPTSPSLALGFLCGGSALIILGAVLAMIRYRRSRQECALQPASPAVPPGVPTG